MTAVHFFVLTFALGGIAGTRLLSAPLAPRCTAVPRVDVHSAVVAGVGLDTTIAVIGAAIGPTHVRRYMVDSEEGRVPAYALRICGHIINRSQEGMSWSDSAYRTLEDLGVGSTLSAFDSTFGAGAVSADMGLQVRYDLRPYPLYVEVGDECYTIGAHSSVDRSCRVSSIFLLLSNRP